VSNENQGEGEMDRQGTEGDRHGLFPTGLVAGIRVRGVTLKARLDGDVESYPVWVGV